MSGRKRFTSATLGNTLPVYQKETAMSYHAGRRDYNRGLSPRSSSREYSKGYTDAWVAFLAENPDRATVATPRVIRELAAQRRAAAEV